MIALKRSSQRQQILASSVKKPKSGEPMGSIAEEIGDIVFVLICLANQLDLSLTEGDAAQLR